MGLSRRNIGLALFVGGVALFGAGSATGWLIANTQRGPAASAGSAADSPGAAKPAVAETLAGDAGLRAPPEEARPGDAAAAPDKNAFAALREELARLRTELDRARQQPTANVASGSAKPDAPKVYRYKVDRDKIAEAKRADSDPAAFVGVLDELLKNTNESAEVVAADCAADPCVFVGYVDFPDKPWDQAWAPIRDGLYRSGRPFIAIHDRVNETRSAFAVGPCYQACDMDVFEERARPLLLQLRKELRSAPTEPPNSAR